MESEDIYEIANTILNKKYFGFSILDVYKNQCELRDKDYELIKDINERGNFNFQDGISSHFELSIYNNFIFLVGDKGTAYLCSHVIESAYGKGLNWLNCYAYPCKGRIYKIENDIRKSPIIGCDFIDFSKQITNEHNFFAFINSYIECYFQSPHFKHLYSLSRHFHNASFWNYRIKIEKLYSFGLLEPFDLLLYSIYNKRELRNDTLLNYFIRSLSESTSKIFSINEILNFTNELSIEEIEVLLSIDIIKEGINFELLNDSTFADLINLDVYERSDKTKPIYRTLDIIKEMEDKIFKLFNIKDLYLQAIKTNFRNLENSIRKKNGYEHVGSYYTEKLIYEKLKKIYPNEKIITQFSPNWLDYQRIDIFFEKYQLGIEYNGIQHYRSIDFFGGEMGLIKQKKYDEIKLNKCKAHDVEIIYLKYDNSIDENIEIIRNFIKNFKNNI